MNQENLTYFYLKFNRLLYMYKKIFFGLLILYIVLPLQAQYVVKGKIVDINKEEVPFSTIQLLGTDSVLVKGCISDSLGIFTFLMYNPENIL